MKSKRAPKKESKKSETKYDPNVVPIKVYELLRSGLSLAKCAKVFGVSATAFFKWLKKYPALRFAVDQAQNYKKGEGGDTFREYIFGRLSPLARKTWNRIHRFEGCRNENKIRALLEKKGKHIRQQLFFYALVHANFNISTALRKVCLSHTQYQAWMQRDPEFAKLVKEIDWHKGNYFEGALMKLVRDGDSAATIFASKTFNRNRGYNDKVEVDIHVEHKLSPLQQSLESLTVEDRKRILDSLRGQREQKLIAQDKKEAAGEVIDAEFEVKPETKRAA